MKFGFDWPSGLEMKIFEKLQGRTAEHVYTTSSPCEHYGLGELKNRSFVE